MASETQPWREFMLGKTGGIQGVTMNSANPNAEHNRQAILAADINA